MKVVGLGLIFCTILYNKSSLIVTFMEQLSYEHREHISNGG